MKAVRAQQAQKARNSQILHRLQWLQLSCGGVGAALAQDAGMEFTHLQFQSKLVEHAYGFFRYIYEHAVLKRGPCRVHVCCDVLGLEG